MKTPEITQPGGKSKDWSKSFVFNLLMVLNQETGPIHPHLSEKKPESAILALPASRVPTKHVMQASGKDEDEFIFPI